MQEQLLVLLPLVCFIATAAPLTVHDAAASGPPVDLTVFENQVLPRWIENFQITSTVHVDGDGNVVKGGVPVSISTG